MGTKSSEIGQLHRRDEVLAILVERITRAQGCPTYEEIGHAMVPQVSKSRAQHLVTQLVRRGDIVRKLGSQRGIQLCDVARCRKMIEQALEDRGWRSAVPVGVHPYTSEQLPYLPLIVKEHPAQ